MNQLCKLLLCATLTTLVSACATTESVKPEIAQQIKRVAVVSTIGDVFQRQYTGATVFGNEWHELKVPQWGLNRIYEEQLAAELRKSHGMTVALGSDSAETAAQIVKAASAGNEADMAAIGKLLPAYCAANSLDAVFVVVRPRRSVGVGVYSVRHPQIGWEANLVVASQLALYGCTARDYLATRVVRAEPPKDVAPKDAAQKDPVYKKRKATGPVIPSMPLPEGWPWYGKWEPELYEKARVEVIKLPQAGWTETLSAMLKPAL